jgi:Tau95 Triple barrel domain/RNA polymerase III transcription factor (TF)IIIC subunit HTH domain
MAAPLAFLQQDRTTLLVASELPVFVQRPSSVYNLLGGEAQVASSLLASSASKSLLPLFLRPEDPVSHPVVAEASTTSSFLLRVERRLKHPERHANAYTNDESTDATSAASSQAGSGAHLKAYIVGPIKRTFRFNSLADFQYLPSSCPLMVTAPILTGVFQELREGQVQKVPSTLLASSPSAPSNSATKAATTTAPSQATGDEPKPVGYLADLEGVGPFYAPPHFSPYGQPQAYKLSTASSAPSVLSSDHVTSGSKALETNSAGGRSHSEAKMSKKDRYEQSNGRLSQRRAFFAFDEASDSSDTNSSDEDDGKEEGLVMVPSKPLPIDTTGIKRLDDLESYLKEAFEHRPVWTKDGLEAFLASKTFFSFSFMGGSSSSSSPSTSRGGTDGSTKKSLSDEMQEEYGMTWPKALVAFAYFTQRGAYRNCWLRLGYDPRKPLTTSAATTAAQASSSGVGDGDDSTVEKLLQERAIASLYQYIEAKVPEPYHTAVGLKLPGSQASNDLYWPGGEAKRKRLGLQLIDLYSMGLREVVTGMATSTSGEKENEERKGQRNPSSSRPGAVLPAAVPSSLFDPTTSLRREADAAPPTLSSSSSSATSALSPWTFVVGMDGRSVFKMSTEKLLAFASETVMADNRAGVEHISPIFDSRCGWLNKRALEGYRAAAQLLLCSFLEAKLVVPLVQARAVSALAGRADEAAAGIDMSALSESSRSGTLNALLEVSRRFLFQKGSSLPRSTSSSASSSSIPLVKVTAKRALKEALKKLKKKKPEAESGRGRRAAATAAAEKIKQGLQMEAEADSESGSSNDDEDEDEDEDEEGSSNELGDDADVPESSDALAGAGQGHEMGADALVAGRKRPRSEDASTTSEAQLTEAGLRGKKARADESDF